MSDEIEVQFNEETAKDMDAISSMLKIAKLQGLETEVVWSFANELIQGNSISDSVSYALSEWDI